MAKVGIIGAGKLGLPVGLAIEDKGHTVSVYDINPSVSKYIENHSIPYKEKDLQPLLDSTKIHVAQSIEELVNKTDIVFCAIQTPHEPRFEGDTPLPNDRADFNYTYLKDAVATVAEVAKLNKKRTTLAVISTCLPGTYNREIKPLLNEWVDYVYTPQFIAMGTVLEDYLNPEFNLIGVESKAAADQLERFYTTINSAPNLRTDITTAEAIKVSYNTFITMKTVLANSWGEMAHRIGFNIDDVTKAWSMSTKRLLSPKYLKSGVGDSGGCHPRDNIALSWLADEVGMSSNIWEDLMSAREEHMHWLAHEAFDLSIDYELPLIILGRSFKPETNIETGSSAILMSNLLKDHDIEHLHLEDTKHLPEAVYVIATSHEKYKHYAFPKGSIVLDPFRYIPDRNGVTIIKVGNPHGRITDSSTTKTESTPAVSD